MKFIPTFAVAFLMLIIFQANASTNITVNSPNQIVQLKVTTEADGSIWYSVNRKEKAVILPSTFSFKLSKPEVVLQQFIITAIDSSAVDESWQPVWGELKNIRNHYKQLTLTLADKNNSGIIIKLVFRIFDDGAAFRYEFPEQKKL